MGKHAYLILAHKNFNQLKILLKLLDHPRNEIFIHVDAKSKEFKPEEFNSICRYSNTVFLNKRYSVNWGGVSIMKAELALLSEAVAMGCHDYYHLLSGLDLPIKTQDEIHSFFDENAGKEFIKFWDFKKSTYSRFRYYTIFPEGEGKFKTRIINHIFKGLQVLAGFRINGGINFKFGSQWFSITESLAKHVLDNQQWLDKVFRNTSTCDEIFLPTLVWNSPFRENLFVSKPVASQKEVNKADMRLIDWTRGASIRHPWVFTKDDYDMLIKSDLLWARKFDENIDADIITMIYEKIVAQSNK